MKPFAELIEFLVDNVSPEKMLAFRASDDSHDHFYELVEKEKTGTISESERREINQFLMLEHIVKSAKVRVRSLDYAPVV